ncbi:unnamed protein product, partial [Strongylus vulgaris]
MVIMEFSNRQIVEAYAIAIPPNIILDESAEPTVRTAKEGLTTAREADIKQELVQPIQEARAKQSRSGVVKLCAKKVLNYIPGKEDCGDARDPQNNYGECVEEPPHLEPEQIRTAKKDTLTAKEDMRPEEDMHTAKEDMRTAKEHMHTAKEGVRTARRTDVETAVEASAATSS